MENVSEYKKMNKLEVNYLGLKLKSPLIVSSSRLTSRIDLLKEAENSGAGAVVLKSLFEEQIDHFAGSVPDYTGYPEAGDYISNYMRANSVDEYLTLIRTAKATLSIPVIPSINCYTSGGWIDFAKTVESAGADALEVNVFFLPVDRKKSPAEAEKVYLELTEKLRKALKIPFAVKLGFRFSNILNMIDNLYVRGANGVVLFNRFYEPDININSLELVPSGVFSSASEVRYVLRWIAMASSEDIRIDISASTGVHNADDAIKYILAGASSVQVCSVLYQKGIGYIAEMNSRLSEWMDNKGFSTIKEFRGKLNYRNAGNPVIWERTQFMKYFSSED